MLYLLLDMPQALPQDLEAGVSQLVACLHTGNFQKISIWAILVSKERYFKDLSITGNWFFQLCSSIYWWLTFSISYIKKK